MVVSERERLGGSLAERAELDSARRSSRYSCDSDGWRCQRMHIRRMTRARTGVVRGVGVEVVMDAG